MKEKLKRILNLATQAVRLLEELEAALDAGNQRVVGARLYELKRQLHIIREAISG